MKPPRFDYYDPHSLDEALALLARYGPEAKVLAGGQSLMPLLNMRLVAPAALVDLNRLPDLAYVRVTPAGLALGALARQRQVERAEAVVQGWPLLAAALRYVGYPQIRTRGTVGGSLAHADPAAELPAVMLALEARLVLSSQRGRRTLPAAAFFLAPLTTALAPDELLCEVQLPPLPPRTGHSFQEVSRVWGAFALVGAAALVTLDDAGRCQQARLALTGVGPVPQRASAVEAALAGEPLDAERLRQAAALVEQDLNPESDVHASAAYRRHLARVLAQRTLQAAWRRAQEAQKA
ncbi:MAG: molybdopterin dehydrogenase [Candidatus Tectimicrobiota bacterium]|nr:MAG: molybdopterin dehydrogenase [Candidatus Tectomicrobia bacterium]